MSDDDLQRVSSSSREKKDANYEGAGSSGHRLERTLWRASQDQIDPHKVVFIDETWAKTNMTRRYGRSPLGTRLVEKTPCGHWQTTTFLGALRAEGFIAPLTIDGALNGPLFCAWVEQHLAPALKPGDIVVMDNLSSHKVAGVRTAIEATGLNFVTCRLTTRSEPHRAGVCQAEETAARLGGTNRRQVVGTMRSTPGRLHGTGMPKLLPTLAR